MKYIKYFLVGFAFVALFFALSFSLGVCQIVVYAATGVCICLSVLLCILIGGLICDKWDSKK